MSLSPHMLDAIERYSDRGMSDAESAAFEARLAEDPALAAEVGLELTARDGLREALRRVMSGVVSGAMSGGGASSAEGAGTAPAGLRERVIAALDAAGDAAGDGALEWESGRELVRADASDLTDDDGDALPWTPPRTLKWLEAPRRANVLAVAASIALVAGAISFGIFGPRISDRPARGAEDTPVTEVAERMSAVHQECAAHATCGAQNEPWRSREEAQSFVSSLLWRPVQVPDLSAAGFNFCCGGPFCVPGACDRGAQLLYCRVDEESGQCGWMSVLVAPVETPYLAFDPLGRTGPLQCGIEYSLATPTGGSMHYWCDGVTTWFLKSDTEIDFESLRGLFPAG